MELLTKQNLKQIGLLALIVIVGITITKYLAGFIPGILGAATLYILMRKYFYKLTIEKKWKKWYTALLFILAAIIVFVLPIIFIFQAFLPKFEALFTQGEQLSGIISAVVTQLQKLNIPIEINSEKIYMWIEKASASVPALIGAAFNFLTNTVMAFFILYFMLVQGWEMEDAILDYLPLKNENVDEIWEATRVMVVSNAIGIPVLAISQGLVAIIGYYIFGVNSFILWGILTGIFSIVPIVGCAIIWVPLCLYLTAMGKMPQAIGLAVYSTIITGGVDNVLRFTILKRIGDIHPITTTLGIIVGVPLFGFMGFIFGPLLVSYFLLLVKVYRVEFSTRYKLKKDGEVYRQ